MSFPNSIGASNYTGRLFRGNASLAPATRWQHLTHSNSLGTAGGGTASNTAPHGDSREMVMDLSGRIIETDDGGIFRRTNPQNNTGDWTSMVGTSRATELHDVAYDAVSNKIVAGSQDNGTPFQNSAGNWEITSGGGDGGDVAVDDITLAGTNQSVRFTSFQNLQGLTRRTFNASGAQTATAACSLAVITGPAISAQFYTPVKLNKITPTRLLIGAANGVYESLDQGATCNRITGLTTSIGDGSSGVGLAYGGNTGVTPNPDVIYAVTPSDDTHVYIRTTAGGSLTASGAITPKVDTDNLLDVALDSTNWQNGFVIDSNQVFRTTNGGSTWTNITGDLTGVGQFHCVEFVPTSGGGNVVVGTQTGVYTAKTSAPTSWNRVGTNMPAAAYVWDMEYDATDNVLVAGTLGRGAWLINNAAAVISDSAVGEWINY